MERRVFALCISVSSVLDWVRNEVAPNPRPEESPLDR
jgi:hypothetical protein